MRKLKRCLGYQALWPSSKAEPVVRVGLAALGMSAIMLGQEAPMAVYPGSERKIAAQEARFPPPGYAIKEQRPAHYHLPLLSELEKNPGDVRPLPRIGVRRRVPAEALETSTTITLPDGRRLWRMTIASEGASSLRIHFRRFGARGGHVWVYAPPQDAQPVQSDGPFTDAGPFGDGEFWTRTLHSDAVTVEYIEPNPNSGGAMPPFEIDWVLHLWNRTLGAAGSDLPQPGAALPDSAEPGSQAAAPCHLDATCYSQYRSMANGVVRFNYVGDDGSSYVCTGSMINTRNRSFKPYLLTANHCIKSDAEARSIQAYFFYQTSTCNGLPPYEWTLPTVIGGRYLTGAPFPQGDYALVLLNANAPAGTYFLGWNTAGLGIGNPAVSIHHPAGSWKRISFGSRAADADGFVDGQRAPADKYYRMSWSQGKTERGSSGSPLLNDEGQILGTLSYGPIVPPGSTICDINPEVVGYGRFANAYPAIGAYLEDTPPPSLTVTPSSLAFTVRNGQYTGPSQQTLTITTQTVTSLSYSATASASWIKLSRLSGAVSASSPSSITVGIDLSYFSKSTVATGTVAIASGTLTPIQVTVQASVTITASKVIIAVTPNPVYQQAADAEGYSWFYTVRLSETAGVATRLMSFRVDEIDYSSNIVSWFGSDLLGGGSTLSAPLRTRGLSVPVNRLFEAAGVDTGTSLSWARQITVSFLPRSTGAVIAMDSSPTLIRQNPNSTDCPWYQQLVLQETGGFGVTLTRFLAGGHDLSSEIPGFWDTSTLPANGSLSAGLCWTAISPPTILEMEVHGTDTNGRSVSAKTSGNFSGPKVNPAVMSVSPVSLVLRAPAGSQTQVTGTITVNLSSSAASWVARLLFPKPPSTWLTVFPLSGSGPATLKVSAQPSGLAQGSYDATLVLEAVDAMPQLLNVPMKLTVGRDGMALPSIASVVNGASFLPGIAASTWVTVVGTNLAPTTRLWRASDFVGNLLPTQLEGVSVNINGKSANPYYISPTQINVLAPDDAALGPVPVEVVTPQGRSTPAMADKRVVSPGWFLFDAEGFKYIAGVHPDGAYLGKPGLYPELNIRPARPGDIIVLYGTGFGPTQPPRPAAELVSQPSPTASPVAVKIGNVAAEVQWAGLVMSGLYQLNVKVPEVPDGDQPVVAQIGGFRTQEGALVTVRR